MSTPAFNRFFALLAFAAAGAVVAVVALVLVARRRPDAGAARALGDLRRSALWLAWVVALVTTLGSLYYSKFAHYDPCEFCWYQRICIYPMSVILLIAALRKDNGIWRYALPMITIGIVIAVYHTQLQAWPDQHLFCSVEEPCNIRHVWEFGFVSLPLMDLVAHTFVFAMLLLARSAERLELTSEEA